MQKWDFSLQLSQSKSDDILDIQRCVIIQWNLATISWSPWLEFILGYVTNVFFSCIHWTEKMGTLGKGRIEKQRVHLHTHHFLPLSFQREATTLQQLSGGYSQLSWFTFYDSAVYIQKGNNRNWQSIPIQIDCVDLQNITAFLSKTVQWWHTCLGRNNRGELVKYSIKHLMRRQ